MRRAPGRIPEKFLAGTPPLTRENGRPFDFLIFPTPIARVRAGAQRKQADHKGSSAWPGLVGDGCRHFPAAKLGALVVTRRAAAIARGAILMPGIDAKAQCWCACLGRPG